MNRNEFITIVAPITVRIRQEGGPLFPSVLMAQTLLETGGNNPEWNNIVGYKVGVGKQTDFWRGRSVNTKTREVINGVNDTKQRADWRAYDSVYDCLKDQALLFRNDPKRYQRVIDAPDPYTQADALYACGYATDAPKEIDGDPDYAEKLRGIIPRFEYLDEEANKPMLEQGIANNIIDGYLKPAYATHDASYQAALISGDVERAEAAKTLREWQRTLANALRRASGQPEE
ncbi:glycoside hydrolase family 73 protein [Paenibacillus oleatilyticus]|uniref:glycoside hydrolase family 73 protein n=1 Tax=Paenibacillus oleatilyticus TaxID=2594886 RepID=UPI001C1FB901|nr:glucosaminidase domain-containing protein [Paenibacillus oleatilyticus]MBU7320261.1 glucosaminidase domain-containing protein [Paenibacillus oleatilyticus]